MPNTSAGTDEALVRVACETIDDEGSIPSRHCTTYGAALDRILRQRDAAVCPFSSQPPNYAAMCNDLANELAALVEACAEVPDTLASEGYTFMAIRLRAALAAYDATKSEGRE